jgi:hypothetical protein
MQKKGEVGYKCIVLLCLPEQHPIQLKRSAFGNADVQDLVSQSETPENIQCGRSHGCGLKKGNGCIAM